MTSNMLIATTVGIPNSKSCVVKNKFLSKLEPSMIFKITSTFPFNKNSRDTTSSKVYGDNE